MDYKKTDKIRQEKFALACFNIYESQEMFISLIFLLFVDIQVQNFFHV